MQIHGTTRIAGVWGWPVGHSLSPVMHNAAFQALKMDWCYVPFAVAPESLADAVRGIRALGIAGVNATIPHKQPLLALMDELDASALAVGAVNTIRNTEGVLRGYSTDAEGFLGALRHEGFEPAGKRAVVLGAGGAARSIVTALAQAGATSIHIANRTVSRAETLAALGAAQGCPRCKALPLAPDLLRDALSDAHLLVNTTSVGMHPHEDDPLLVPEDALHSGLTVYDLIYNPPVTRLLAAATAHGAHAINGMRMLVYQGAASFRIWTGVAAPVAVMEDALRAALCSLR